jgi:hypothetical protein
MPPAEILRLALYCSLPFKRNLDEVKQSRLLKLRRKPRFVE